MIICKTVDEIREAVHKMTFPYWHSRSSSISKKCKSASVSPSTLHHFLSGKRGIKVDSLVAILDQFGYKLAIVKDGEHQ